LSSFKGGAERLHVKNRRWANGCTACIYYFGCLGSARCAAGVNNKRKKGRSQMNTDDLLTGYIAGVLMMVAAAIYATI
jgi:hypothetical protein